MTTATRLDELLEAAASTAPGHLAVVDRDHELTYAELFARACKLARLLRSAGVVPGDRVGLLMPKSIDAVVAIYGTLLAGCSYVPLDWQAPPARLESIAVNCALVAVVAVSANSAIARDLVAASPAGKVMLILDSDRPPSDDNSSIRALGASDIAAQSDRPPELRMTSSGPELAYIFYTSGSTGSPKGVMLTHQNALAFVSWAARTFAVGHGDRLASHAPFHFDLSIFDLFCACWASASVVLVPPRVSMFPRELSPFVAANGITVWYSVPAVLGALLQRGAPTEESLRSVRLWLFAGEVLPTRSLRELVRLVPQARVCNLYGPTETNVCTWYDVPRGEPLPDDDLPIGRPIDGVVCRVTTETGEDAALDEVGELLVGGPTVMPGYWADPASSDRVLLVDADGRRFYRTGDLVVWGADGLLRFRGRRDHQIKSRGYRIELGDVESAIRRHANVTDCAAVAVPDAQIGNRVIAWVVVAGRVPQLALRSWCKQQLPAYMVPDEIRMVDSLPRLSTGKIDRTQLASQVSSPHATA